MNRFPHAAILALICVSASCRATGARVEAELLAADRAFAADVQERRLEAWVAAFDEHGSQVGDDFRPITGDAAIRARMQGFFADPANALWWEPDAAHVSEAGNLGSTTGRFRMERRAADGTVEVVMRGRYFDVWRRLPDGRWRLLYDVGDPDPVPGAQAR
jgi:ketosteroid isomerase-like protein